MKHGEGRSSCRVRCHPVAGVLLCAGLLVMGCRNEPEVIVKARRHEIGEVLRLLDRGASVDTRGRNGESILHVLASTGDHATVKVLLERKADPNVTDALGRTPLHVAATLDVRHDLLAGGANPRAVDKAGETALHRAIRAGDAGGVLLLCAVGTDPAARNVEGRTAAELAVHLEYDYARVLPSNREAVVTVTRSGGACEAFAAAYRDLTGPKALAAAYDEVYCQLGTIGRARGLAGFCDRAAFAFDCGDGVPRREDRAAVLYRHACDLGSAYGCKGLGILLSEGRGVTKDPAAALDLFRKACDGGDQDGCVRLGMPTR